MLIKSVETLRDYTTKKSKLFLLLAFLSKVTAYRVKSHLNRVLSYLSLSIKTSVVLSTIKAISFALELIVILKNHYNIIPSKHTGCLNSLCPTSNQHF